VGSDVRLADSVWQLHFGQHKEERFGDRGPEEAPADVTDLSQGL